MSFNLDAVTDERVLARIAAFRKELQDRRLEALYRPNSRLIWSTSRTPIPATPPR